MDILAVLFFLCVLWKLDVCKKGYHEDFLSLEKTKAVKGILAVLVVLHHLYQRTHAGRLLFFFDNVGILCVALFFFLSGYGLQKSYAAKPGYRSRILRRRIPSVLVPYLFLIGLYWLLGAVTGSPATLPEVLASLVNGEPIVSHSWYILCILVFYLGYYDSVLLFGKNQMGILISNILLCVLWAVVCRWLGYGYFWYNGAIAFPMGIFWAIGEEKLLPWLKRHYGAVLAVSALGFGASFVAALVTTGVDIILPLYWLAACLFVLVVLLLLMKFTFRNRVLLFLGEISFEIYGIHGLLELLFRSDVIYLEDPVIWSAAVLLSSVAAAWGLHGFFRSLLRRLFVRQSVT